jgi:hypothetical protein
MKSIKNQGAQGDCLFRKVKTIPDGVKEIPKGPEGHIVAHSETGHHHVILGAIPGELVHHYASGDPLLDYLEVPMGGADAIHLRDHDTHETLRLAGGAYEVRRQREYVPEGWRRVED